MKVIIAGSRYLRDGAPILSAITAFELSHGFISEVVSGGAKGADEFGAQWAEKHGVKLTVFPADWDTYGPAAGPMRNRQMAEYAEGLVLVHTGGKGSFSMKYQAQKLGLKILEVRL